MVERHPVLRDEGVDNSIVRTRSSDNTQRSLPFQWVVELTQALLVFAQAEGEGKVVNLLESSIVLEFLAHSLHSCLHLVKRITSNCFESQKRENRHGQEIKSIFDPHGQGETGVRRDSGDLLEVGPSLDKSCTLELAHLLGLQVPSHDQHDNVSGVNVQSHTELFHALDQDLILLV